MVNRKLIRRIVALALVGVLTVPPMCPKAQNTNKENDIINQGYLDIGYNAPFVENEIISDGMVLATGSYIPESYSSVEKGYVTSVKNQYNLGCCWAFSAIATMESYALSHGFVQKPEDIDLSEYALATMTFSDEDYIDAIGGTNGDYTSTNDIYESLNSGGNDNYAFKVLSKWAGIMWEEDAQYDPSGESIVSYDVNKNAFLLTGQYFINMLQTDQIKNVIMSNGAVSSYYMTGDEYYNENETYYYLYKEKEDGDEMYYHAITIVGWDDNMSKDNFAVEDLEGVIHIPENDGAWLVKNSWGTDVGDAGYMWISYEDIYLKNATAGAYEIVPVGTYGYNYQYDGGAIFGISADFETNKYANVFSVAEDGNGQLLKAVSFAVEEADRDYEIRIYLNSEKDLPESGTLVGNVSGSTSYCGYYTVDLDEVIALQPGDTFAVVVEFSKETILTTSVSGETQMSKATITNVSGDNESYVFVGDAYVDLYDLSEGNSANVCIKAFTVEDDKEIYESSITKIAQVAIDKLQVSWQKIDGATYELLRSESPTGEYESIYAGDDVQYTDTVELGKTYFYKVKTGEGENEKISPGQSHYVIVPSTVITETKLEEGIKIVWTKVEGVQGYNVYRSIDGEIFELLGAVTSEVLEYTDSAVEEGIEYYYTVTSYVYVEENINESQISNVVSNIKPQIIVVDISELLIMPVEDVLYTGEECRPEVIIKNGEYILEKELDYTINYENNVELGTASITITGMGTYTGSKAVTFRIVEKTIKDVIVTGIDDVIYSGEENVFDIVVTDGENELVENVDFTIIYNNNVNAGEATVEIIGIGSYGNKVVKTFIISPKNMGDATINNVEDKTYTGELIEQDMQSVNVIFEEKMLVYGTDYEVEYSDNKMPGIATMTIKGIGNYVGVIQKQFFISYRTLDNVTVEPIGSLLYTGEEIKPEVKLIDGEMTLIKDYEYTVTYENNIEIGEATITITGIGVYEGVIVVKFNIVDKLPQTITSDVVNINEESKIISKIAPGMTVEAFIAGINEDVSIVVKKNDVEVLKSDILGTDMKVYLTNGDEIVTEYTVIVTGDTNGDGKINITDMIAVKAHILEKTLLEGNKLSSGDVNGDGKINITDFIKIKATILGKDNIYGVVVN